MIAILCALLSWSAQAQEVPGTNWDLNPKFKLQKRADRPQTQSQNGFTFHLTSADFELDLKGTKFPEKPLAVRMMGIELNNVEKLYSARGNPYEGQITEVIQCTDGYKPKRKELKVAGQAIQVLVAGANGRKMMGACAQSQIEYWVGYFTFFDEPSVVEARIYVKAPQPSKAKVEELTRKVQSIALELFVAKAKP